MPFTFKEMQEKLNVSRFKLLKVVDENKNELRPYLRKGKKGSYNFTKSAIPMLSQYLGINDPNLVANSVIPETQVEEKVTGPVFEQLEISNETAPQIIQMLYEKTVALQYDLDETKKKLDIEVKKTSKFRREYKKAAKNRAEAMKVLFPFTSTAVTETEAPVKKRRYRRRKQG